MKEVKAYQCEYCKRISRTIAGIKRHEKSCKFNPEVNHCANCVYGCMKEGELFEEPYCNIHKVFIFQEEKRDNAYLIECETNYHYDASESPIPYTCVYFESKGWHGFKQELDT